jgi:hypothetical protein
MLPGNTRARRLITPGGAELATVVNIGVHCRIIAAMP